MNRIVTAALLAGTIAAAALAQERSALAFEVASVKPTAPLEGGGMMISTTIEEGRIRFVGVPLKSVLVRAFDVKEYQIVGPAWLTSERYDIDATYPAGATKNDVPAMLRALLAERFKLKFHMEPRELSIYALLAPKGASKLKPADPNAPMPVMVTGVPGAPLPPPPPAAGGGGQFASVMVTRAAGAGNGHGATAPKGISFISSNGHLQTNGTTMAAFATMLSNMLDRPVVDKTGVEGDYDITMDVAPDDLVGLRRAARGAPLPAAHASEGPAPSADPAPSIFTAIQQYGLKLEAQKSPVDHVIVDSMEKTPTEN